MHRIAETPLGWQESESADNTWTLGELRHHYGSAYTITGEGSVWRAVRKDGKGTLRTDSANALLDLIRADSAASPVPR